MKLNVNKTSPPLEGLGVGSLDSTVKQEALYSGTGRRGSASSPTEI